MAQRTIKPAAAASRSIKDDAEAPGRFKSIRQGTRAIIARRVEDFDYDIKESVNGLKVEDLVAFANSEGGTIVIGVRDNTTDIVGEGDSRPESIDEIKRNIIQKARSCIPPLSITVEVENLKSNSPVYVIQIPKSSGLTCTSGGTYKKRENGQNSFISPEEMKVRILEQEVQEFSERLVEAAKDIERQIAQSNEYLERMGIVQNNIEAAVNEAVDAAHDAREAAQEATDAAYNAAAAAEDR